jgi:hypothetical protein
MTKKLLKMFILSLYLGSNFPAFGADISEYALKAVFLLNITKYVAWPDGSFPSPGAPLVIGVIGDDPFGKTLDDTVYGKTANGRPIRIRRFDGFIPGQAASLRKCQILFICSSEAADVPEILKLLKGSSVLTISNIEGFSAKGGGISFILRNSRLALQVNLETVKSAGFEVSSKLLEICEIYKPEGD